MLKKIRWQIAQFFELIWWRRYLGQQSPSNYLNWKRNYWITFLQALPIDPIIFESSNTNILDIGCGPAGLFILNNSAKLIAVDPLISAYEQNLRVFKKQHFPAVNFIESSIERFESKQEFDIVFCINCINHVIDIKKSLARLHLLTSSEGLLVLSTDAHRFSLLKHLFKLIPGDILHPHQYDLEEYKSLITQAGFRIERELLVKRESIFDYYAFVLRKN